MSFTERFSFDTVLNRLDEAKIAPINKEYIKQHDLILSAKGIKKARRKKYIDVLRWWAGILQEDFKKANKEDLIRAVDMLQSDKILAQKGKPFAESTKELHKAVLKTFYKWLQGDDEMFPEKIRWLNPKLSRISNKLPQDILKEEDVQLMLQFADNARDQAIIMLLYESGARASEFLGMKIKDIPQEKKGIRAHIDGKTGRRDFLVVASVPYLIRYLNTHPARKEPSAPLWYTIQKGQLKTLSYENFKRILRDVGKRAKIAKPCNPHHYRHSAETRDANFMTECQLATKYGHVIGSKMIRKYVHLSGKDTDSAILNYYGLAARQDEQSLLKPMVCERCGFENARVDSCERCGGPVSHKAKLQERKNKMGDLEERLKKVEAALNRRLVGEVVDAVIRKKKG